MELVGSWVGVGTELVLRVNLLWSGHFLGGGSEIEMVGLAVVEECD